MIPLPDGAYIYAQTHSTTQRTPPRSLPDLIHQQHSQSKRATTLSSTLSKKPHLNHVLNKPVEYLLCSEEKSWFQPGNYNTVKRKDNNETVLIFRDYSIDRNISFALYDPHIGPLYGFKMESKLLPKPQIIDAKTGQVVVTLQKKPFDHRSLSSYAPTTTFTILGWIGENCDIDPEYIIKISFRKDWTIQNRQRREIARYVRPYKWLGLHCFNPIESNFCRIEPFEDTALLFYVFFVANICVPRSFSLIW